MLFFDANVASENRPVGTESEPTRKRDSKTDQAPGDATQTAASRVYHSSENGGGIAGAEVLIQIAKYGIIVLAFVGEFQHQRTLVSPTPTETGMKARKPNPMKTCKYTRLICISVAVVCFLTFGS